MTQYLDPVRRFHVAFHAPSIPCSTYAVTIIGNQCRWKLKIFTQSINFYASLCSLFATTSLEIEGIIGPFLVDF